MTLPSLFTCSDGSVVRSADDWRARRRPEILETLAREVYGTRPVERPPELCFEPVGEDTVTMDGRAVRKRVRIVYSGEYGKGSFLATAFIPASATEAAPAPAFLFINNRGPENIDPERKVMTDFWPAERIVARGYAAVAFNNKEVAPDRYDHFASGVYAAFEHPVKRVETPWGATWGTRTQESWGAISAWAWGASRVMDWIGTEPLIDSAHVAVAGHSRGGKTSLWAAATDERFAMACVNGSGQCGAQLRHYSGSPYGQTIEDITRRFPHWFCWRFNRWIDRDLETPFDQHWALALVAPRLLYVSGSAQDLPASEFKACVAASPAWELYGRKGVIADGYPGTGVALDSGAVAFRRREGIHTLMPSAWNAYMDFADKNGWTEPK